MVTGFVAALFHAAAAVAQTAEQAQGSKVGEATLPRDLSPWGMFSSADIVVKSVIVGLAFASLMTWTVWLAKTIELAFAKRGVRGAVRTFERAASLSNVDSAELTSSAGAFYEAAAAELRMSADARRE